MEKLQINMNEEAEIRKEQQQKMYRLEIALRRQAQPNAAEHIGLMEAADPNPDQTAQPTPLELNYTEEGENDFLTKRQLENDATYARMPQKRVAITTANDSPYNMPRRFTPPPAMPPNNIPPPPSQPPTSSPDLSKSGGKMPRQRVAFQAAPYGASPSATDNRRTTASTQDAASIADDKGRDLANQLAKLKFDGSTESAVLPKAVMYCAAGHLLGDTSLISKGRNLAREVEMITHRLAPGQPILNFLEAGDNNPAAYLREDYSQPDNVVELLATSGNQKVSTLKVNAQLAGNEINSIVDTGASSCAVSYDCLRGNGLAHLLSDVTNHYVNADGYTSQSKGRVFMFHTPLTIGAMTTLYHQQ
eukprot:GHRQ01010866.1.p1 GENE.GHRQ01010866.1~~GHRQ01010866.1.p1  ORF type:complete len:361 (-),score=34.98 GHRQ01010866.1:1079-2161(-)